MPDHDADTVEVHDSVPIDGLVGQILADNTTVDPDLWAVILDGQTGTVWAIDRRTGSYIDADVFRLYPNGDVPNVYFDETREFHVEDPLDTHQWASAFVTTGIDISMQDAIEFDPDGNALEID